MSVTEDLIKLFNAYAHTEKSPEVILEIHGGDLYDKAELVAEEFIEEHRWYNLYLNVYYIKDEDRYVGVYAENASTENQEHDSGDAFEVKPKQVVTTVYTEV